MKNKVLKLCKRLNKVTASEIAPILMLDEKEVSDILNELVNEDKLTVREDLIYFYKEVERKTPLPLFFEYREKEEIELLIRCFSCEIPSVKASWLLKIKEPVICRFYSYFRELIYNKQLEELKVLFNKNPKIPCERNFVGVLNFMYYYNGQTYISKKKLLHKHTEKPFSKIDMLEFKKDYSKLTRRVNHNSMQNLVHLHLAEQIFRFNHNYDEVYNETTRFI